MACSMDRVLLEEYAEGMLPKLESILLEEHIKSCSTCKKQLTELKLLFWEIQHAAEQNITLPQEVDKVFDNLIDQFAKAKTTEKALGMLKNGSKAVSTGVALVTQNPLAKALKAGTSELAKKGVALTDKALDQLKAAGKKKVKTKVQDLLGGIR